MFQRALRTVLAVIVGALLVIGVGVGGVRLVRMQLALRAIDVHERRWLRERPTDYRYELEVLCFCHGPGPFDITIHDGRIVAVSPTPNGPIKPSTIEALFDEARDAIRRGADDVDITYAADGHPTKIKIDEYADSYDDEVYVSVRDLRPTAPVDP